jgi:hypothetical protein
MLLASASSPPQAEAMPGASMDGIAYAFVSRMKGGGEEGRADFIVRISAGDEAFRSGGQAAWDDLAKAIFWPFANELPDGDGALIRYVTIVDDSLPPVEGELTIARTKVSSGRGARCSGYELTLAGEAAVPAEEEAVTGMSGVELEGAGRALICAGEILPLALEMAFVRRPKYAPWSASGSARHNTERIEAAWARIP